LLLALSKMTNLVRSPIFNEFAQLVNAFEMPLAQSNVRNNLNYRITTEDDAAIAEVEVPGVAPADVKVRIEGRSLTVETPRGSAYFTIGQRIDAEHTTADLKHGLLTLRIPKRDAKVVEVNVHIEE
jgi:HSP20 family molecular chaperone IbpA